MKTSQLICAVLMSAVGSSFFLMLPVVLPSAAIALALDEIKTGYLASAYFCGFLVTGLALPVVARLLSPRQLSYSGFAVLIVSLVAASLSGNYLLIMLMLFFTGAGAGVLFGNAFAVISVATNVERWFGLKLTSEQLLGAFLLLLLPFVADDFSQSMLILAVIFTLMVVIVRGLPDLGSEISIKVSNDSSVSASSDSRVSIPANVRAGLLALMIKFMGMSGLWAFLERLARPLNIDNGDLSTALGFALVGGLLGGLIASWQGHRWQRRKPLLIVSPLLIVVILCYWQPLSFSFFTINTFCLSLLWNYTLAYELSIVAGADKDNEFSCLMSPALALGAIIGPMIAGHLIVNWQLPGLLLLAIVAIVISLTILVWLDRRNSVLAALELKLGLQL